MDGDIDLRRDKEHLKAIRRGEVAKEDVLKWAAEKERHLETLYLTSKLRDQPEKQAIRQLLLDCLEHHYGSLAACVTQVDPAIAALRQIQEIASRGLRNAQE